MSYFYINEHSIDDNNEDLYVKNKIFLLAFNICSLQPVSTWWQEFWARSDLF